MRAVISILSLFLTISSTAQSWSDLQKIVASDRGVNDNFSYSVSIFGEHALIGAPKDGEDTTAGFSKTFSGSAYIFHKDQSGNWQQEAKLVAPDAEENDYFGSAVAIEGPFAIIGAPYEDENVNGMDSLPFSGSAYIYEKDATGSWALVQKIVAADRDAEDYFGSSVSIDGSFAIIGALFEDHDTAGGSYMPQAGAAYVFRRDSAGSWSQVQKLVAADRAPDDHFANSVALSGSYALIGARNEKDDILGQNALPQAGSAYIFRQGVNGNWSQVQKITAPDREAGDHFGNAVAISGDHLIVGSPEEDEDGQGMNTLNSAGSAYIFERDTSGQWSVSDKIVASDRDQNEFFGLSVGIYGDYAVAGAYYCSDDQNGGNYVVRAGAAYVYARQPNGEWLDEGKLVATDRGEYDQFGHAVSISADHVLCGAFNEDEDINGGNTSLNAGSAYLFYHCGSKESLNLNACDPYLSPSGNHLWSSSGMYADTIPNTVGCDSIIFFNLTITEIDTSVLNTGNALLSAEPGALYQWLDCDNGFSIIPGQISQSFSPGLSGNYAVEVSLNNCRDTSSCHPFIVINDESLNYQEETTVFPNPASGEFRVRLPEGIVFQKLTILDLSGREIFETDIGFNRSIRLQSPANPGTYLLEFRNDEGVSLMKKLIIKPGG